MTQYSTTDQAMKPIPIILFLHIPKAGGTALSELIHPQVQTKTAYSAEDGLMVSGVFYYPAGFTASSYAVSLFPSWDANRIKNVLNRHDLRAVAGHFCFGIHQYVPGPSTYITMLRDPVERALSLYHFQRLAQKQHGTLTGVKIPEQMTLKEFVTSPPYKEVDNGQTRRIAGQNPDIGGCHIAMLRQAQHNLRQYFSVVGVTEQFDETLLLLARRFGWRRQPGYHKHTNPDRPPAHHYPQETVNIIRKQNELDCELYEFAQKLLQESISAEGAGFYDELCELQAQKTG